jgi:hypothetical protein
MLTLTVCPTPIGAGAMLMKAYVGSVQAGVCALAFCIEAAIGIVRIAKNKIVIALFFIFCIFLPLFNCVSKSKGDYVNYFVALTLANALLFEKILHINFC